MEFLLFHIILVAYDERAAFDAAANMDIGHIAILR
jgi:hypothetical protein